MILAWVVLALAWFNYSYGFVDFNLTLSNNPFILRWIGYFQHLVYFDRQHSVQVYLCLLVVTWVLYLLTVWRSKKIIWWQLAAITILLALSYPMLTHDVFNYLFHARIVVTYHANPHVLAPQVFTGDEWLRFMHWVHAPSAYGPVFTAIMIVPYILGLTKLTGSLICYKLLAWASYLLSTILVGKIARRGMTINDNKAQLLFAFNPIILSEWLINAHNEVLMVTLMLLSWWLVGEKKYTKGWLSLLLSAGLKYAAILIAPALILWRWVGEHIALVVATMCLLVVPFFYHFDWQYQIWYITWAVPFAILTGRKQFIGVTTGYAIGGMLIYAPYIATGFWSLTVTAKLLYLLVPAAACLVGSYAIHSSNRR